MSMAVFVTSLNPGCSSCRTVEVKHVAAAFIIVFVSVHHLRKNQLARWLDSLDFDTDSHEIEIYQLLTLHRDWRKRRVNREAQKLDTSLWRICKPRQKNLPNRF